MNVAHDGTPVRSLHHVSFRVDDVGASLAFYVDLMGCEQLPRPDLGVPGAWLRLGAVEIHLIQVGADHRTGSPPAAPTGLTNHVAFQVDDIDGFRAELERRGFDAVEGSPLLPQLFVQDPSGNVIEFTAAGPP